MPHALVTGADGFIGHHLVPTLRRHNYRVSGVARRGLIDGLDQQFHTLDLTPAQLQGVDVVFHLAGLAHAATYRADQDALNAVNVHATRTLCERAMAAGVARFVHLSSIKVLGDSSGDHAWSPQQSKAPQDPYATSKALAEDALHTLIQQADTPLTLSIVRPPLTYGPGVKANFLKLLGLALSRWPLPLGGARQPRAWLAVGNLCSLLSHLASAPDAAGIWHVRDEAQSSVSDMLALISRGRCRQWSLPGLLPLGRLLGVGPQLERLFLPLRVDMQATCERLDWTPPLAQAQAIEETVRWYQQQA